MITQEQYKNQLEYLYSFLPKVNYLFPGDLGLRRTKVLLKLLGNPQENIKIIHIAGTSGKGSTCYILSSILISQGFKVGLSISPHLFDIRERTQINNKLISKELYCKYLDEIKFAIEKTEIEVGSAPTYFEILTALNFYIFNKENVDYAIMETGLGGTYDATNVIENPDKLSIITRIGFDHTQILGNTLSTIASHKGGIINQNSTVITIKQTKKINKVFKTICDKRNAKLIRLEKKNYKKMEENIFLFRSRGLYIPKVKLGLNGDYQFENTSLSIMALEFLSNRDKFIINKGLLINSLGVLNFLGRFSEIKIKNKIIIFDGAHNPQKMKSFIKSLLNKYSIGKFKFLVAFKHNKDFSKMLETLIPVASSITLTTFGGNKFETLPKSTETELLAKTLTKDGYLNFSEIQDSQEAIRALISVPDEIPIVVTGSLYLLSEFSSYLQNNV